MSDNEFLEWLEARLVNHYGEPKGADVVLRLKEVGKHIQDLENQIESLESDIIDWQD